MVKPPQKNAAYFQYSRFHNIPIVMAIAKNKTTNMLMINIDLGSNALTDAASVGIATFSCFSNNLIGNGINIGNTKEPIKTIKSKDRSLSIFAQPYPVNIITTAASKLMPASPNKITDGDLLWLEAFVGEAVPAGLAGAAVCALDSV